MTIIPITYQAGTMKTKQHTEITAPAFTDTNHVRFQADGRLATIPPYSIASVSGIKGKNRSIYAQRLTGDNEGTYYFFGTHSHLYVELNSVLYNITPIESGAGTTLGTDPLNITDESAVVVVTHTAHGFADGDRIAMSGIAGDLNGIPQADFNREHIITLIDDDSYSITVATEATSTDTAAGGSAVVIKGQIAAGEAGQRAASGMGAGDYGGDLYGAGGSSTTGLQEYPRIWSFDAFGNDVVMCAGDYRAGDGQKIYIWDGDIDVAPSALTNAPTDCQWVLTVNNSVVALCGSTIKISELGDATVWSGLTYREIPINRVDRLNSGFRHGEKNAIIHHGNGVILLRFVGGSSIWDASDLFEEDGVASPLSTARLIDALVWRGRRGFYLYDGGVVKRIENTWNMDWILDNVNQAVEWHSFAVTDTQNSQVYFYFPTGSDDEPNDYVLYDPRQASFTLGEMRRTAAQRPNILDDTFYMADSQASTTDIYRHFTRGATTFDWLAETAFFYTANGEVRFMIDEFRPDSRQGGNITMQIIGREYPQGDDIEYGTYTITQSTRLISVKAAGRLLKLKFSGNNQATLGAWTYNARTLGKRAGKL